MIPGLRRWIRIGTRRCSKRGKDVHVTQYRQEDVDNEVTTASALKEDTKRWEEDGKDELLELQLEHVQTEPLGKRWNRPWWYLSRWKACYRVYVVVKELWKTGCCDSKVQVAVGAGLAFIISCVMPWMVSGIQHSVVTSSSPRARVKSRAFNDMISYSIWSFRNNRNSRLTKYLRSAKR